MRKERSNKGKKRGPYISKKSAKKYVNSLRGKPHKNPKNPFLTNKQIQTRRNKKRVINNDDSEEEDKNRTLKLVANYKSNNNNNTPIVKKRKQRSNKGKKRGPYKNKRTKHKIPNIVVNDYNNTQRRNRENKEWKEVENILFNNNNNNRPLVKKKNKNNRQLGRTRSGRAFRK